MNKTYKYFNKNPLKMNNKKSTSILIGFFKFCRNMCAFNVIVFMFCPPTINAQNFPSGFSQVKVADIYYPTSFTFAPDGRIFATEKAGKVKIIKAGVVLSTPFLQVSVDQLNERGLSSIILDPNFNTNHYVYIYYTTASSPIHNRLSRFTANGDIAVTGSEVTILDFEPVVNSIHNSGGMVFGNDGKLYLAVGNDNVNSNSQDLNNYKGKIIRINSDGSVPSGNPFTGSESAKRIWALGFRNPWSMAIQPGTGKIFANDVGEATWEEINDITTGGKNFGWPNAEGVSTNPAYANPVYTYHHGPSGTDYGCAITGGTFFNPTTTNYPAQYTGKYFFIDYCNLWINYLDLTNGVQKNNFATSVGSANNYIKVGPDGNLYYFSISQNSLNKIIYSNNNAPVVTSQPVNLTISQGQPATFSVSVSGALPINYQWQKKGVNISGANSSSFTINNVQPADSGSYRVLLNNSFGNATSNSATLKVTAFNAKPVATITTPLGGTFYHSQDSIHFSGKGTDSEDGNLPDSSLTWIIYFHHDMHTHPGPTIPPNTKSGAFSSNFGGETAANVYWHIVLVVKDSKGLTDTASVDVKPVTSTLSLNSQPSGLKLTLESKPFSTPYSELAVSGMTRSLGVISPQILNDSNYIFDHWLQGGAASQTITITDNNKTYTAVFKSTGSVLCSASGTITRDYWANVSGTAVANVPVNTTPTSTEGISSFEGPTNAADNYASRIRGYICPPLTGNYIFWISSDDNSELWLSTDDQPSNKIKISSVTSWTSPREWTKSPSQQSSLINLIAGKKYYIEALHKEGLQGDNLAVGWQLPDGSLERPIPGIRLSPYSTSSNSLLVSITSPANNANFSSSSNIPITVNTSSTSSSILKVEFFQGSTKIGENVTAPYSFTWMNVPNGSYALKAVVTNNLGQSSSSQIVNVTVGICVNATITPSGPTTMCSGSVTLKANTGTGIIYQWKKDGVNITGATNSTYTASVTGAYQIKTIQGSCVSWSAPTNVKIQSTFGSTITPGGPTTFCSGQSVILYGNTCSGYGYQWKKNGTDISGANSATYTATTSGSYQLKISQGSANAWSSLVTVTVNNCVAASPGASKESNPIENADSKTDAFNSGTMKVFPNPTTGLFTIEMNLAIANDEKVKIRVVNLLGQEVYNNEFASNGNYLKEMVELNRSLPDGIYTLQVIIGKKAENTKMILSR
jgi:glucose/arabinose dehydrogenase